MEKEYIVGLNKGVDAQQFNLDMISSTGSGAIPQRNINVANARPLSQRLTHYMLTDEEAEQLRNDPRVYSVEIPPEQRKDLVLETNANYKGNFTKTSLADGPFINWGLRRGNESVNPYGGATTVEGNYNYTLDGTGVDIVIQDTGIEPTHPEWEDASGNSRLKQIDWFSESGLTGTQSANHYRDYHGHGTHVAATAAGKNYGWAKNADIYALKVAGLEGSGDTGTGIAVSSCFDVIKEWHNRKAKGKYTPTAVTYTPSSGVMVLTIGNHNLVANDKIQLVPGSLVFTRGSDNDTAHYTYPKSTDTASYKKDLTITEVTSTTITVNVGSNSDQTTRTFVSAITGAIEVRGTKRKQRKRPTIVNMSWGYSSTFTGITGGSYRGTPWTGTSKRSDYGMIGSSDLKYNTRVSSVDVDIQELIDAGVHVVIASGNRSQKIDVPGGDDYDNYFTNQFGNRYYHRGGSPFDDQAINVGNIDSDTKVTAGKLEEQKASSSNTGPGVDIYAPGTNIMAACSTLTAFPSSQGTYYFDSGFKQANISGTSMASPQISGVLAFYLQLNPDASVAEAKKWLTDNAVSNTMYDSSGDDDYTDDRSLLGGDNLQTLNLYGSEFGLNLTVADDVASSIGSGSASYSLSSNINVVNESGSFTVTLATTNVTAGTSVPYTITGIDSDDLSSGSLTGNFVVGTTDSLTFTLDADTSTEGNETITFALDNDQASVQILVIDTSTDSPTYSLTSTKSSANEGSTFIISLVTTNVTAGTNIPYTITGVSSADINSASLTGNFVEGTTNSITYTVTADSATEGTETFALALDNGEASVSVTINDTSTTPVSTYSLTRSVANVNEGDSFTITLATTNVASGTAVPFTITGVSSADIGDQPLTGQFTVGTQDTVTFNVSADSATEGSETFRLALNGRSEAITVVFNDTSVGSAPSYTLSTSASTVNEGQNFTITLATVNVDAGTSVDYTITGVDTGDIGNASLTGSFVTGTTDSVQFSVTADQTTEGSETFRMALDNGEDTIDVAINDTSTTPAATYTLTTSASSADEGDSVTITLNTQNVSDATDVPYTVTGINAQDLSSGSLTGNFTISSNTATQAFTFANDSATEGSETFLLTLDNGADDVSVVISDTSTGSGNSYTINVTAYGASDYTMSGTDANGAVNGSDPSIACSTGDTLQFSVNTPGHPFWLKTSATTGTGNGIAGVSNNGTSSGTVSWTPTATGTYHYICQFHAGMTGTITVS